MFQYALPCGSDSTIIRVDYIHHFNTHSLAGVIRFETAVIVSPYFNTHSLAGVIHELQRIVTEFYFNTHSLAGVSQRITS